MFRNPDMIMGAIEGQDVVYPDWHKVFLFAGTDSKITQHECLFEGKGAYQKLYDHVILAQITVKANTEEHGTYKNIENTPVGTPINNLIPRDILISGGKLWRYLDYFKFEDLIKSKSLYFSRLDKFEDNLEGVSPFSCIKAIASDPEKNDEQKREAIRLYNIRMQANRKNGFASCWHINEGINYEMWDLYGKNSKESIVIQTNEKRIESALRKTGFPILTEPVQYFDEPYFNQNAYWFPTMFKRKEFKHEREFRCIFYSYGISHNGLRLPVSLSELIQRIYVHPDATNQFFKDLRYLLKSNNIQIPIRKAERRTNG